MSWDRLSMAEKAEIMKLAVQSGVYDLDAIRNGYNEYAKGGKIHIKPENRGKFTALKKRTGHSATWFKQHGTPAQKKMATFALNARKWKHGEGGNLYGGETQPTQQMITTGGAGYIPPQVQLDGAVIRQNLYDNLSPHSYQNLSDAVKSVLGINTGATHTLEDISVNPHAEQPIDDAIWATYLGIPKDKRHRNSPELTRSKYTPSQGKEDVTYYKFPIIDGIDYIIEEGLNLPIGSNKITNMDSSSAGVGNVGDYTIGHGYDNKGEYVSVYDKWDVNPFKGSYRLRGLLGDIGNSLFGKRDDLSFGIGKPVNLYDRIYLDNYYGVKEPTHSTYLPEITITGKKRKK